MAKRIVDKAVCEGCKKRFDELDGGPTNGEWPHHVITRGAGGPDHRLNLIQLRNENHTKAHSGRIKKETLFAAIARREGWDSGDLVEEAVRLMMRSGQTIEEMEN